MKTFLKVLIFGVVLLPNSSVIAQAPTPAIGEKLPVLIAPSPSVSALMKFEEVPVSNYTGTPDISIPLVSLKTKSPDITLNVTLSYHPAAAAGNSVAGNVGLGWSLLAGGTISRTVRGFPDEKVDVHTYGIRFHTNHYEDILALVNNHASGENYDTFWHYLYDVEHLNKFDSQYDIYQYNFMGRSGRFFLNKDYDVVHLENSTLKIIYNAIADEFVIYDEKGNKYLFNIRETSKQTTFSEIKYFDENPGGTMPIEGPEFVSAYHLKSVESATGGLLAELNYSGEQVERIKNRSEVNLEMMGYGPSYGRDFAIQLRDICNESTTVQRLEPRWKLTVSTTNIKTRKLISIIIPDNSKVEFTNVQGREDYNLLGDSSSKISALTLYKFISDDSYGLVKTFDLKYNYQSMPGYGPRLFLREVEEICGGNSLSHKFEYKRDEKIDLLYPLDVGLDHWGYFTETPYDDRHNKNASREFSSNNILQKIILPTGGCKIFDFESNTYSYTGHNLLPNFDENPDNWELTDEDFVWVSVNNPTGDADSNTFTVFSFEEEVHVITVGHLTVPDEAIHLYKYNNTTGHWENTGTGIGCSYDDCTASLHLQPGMYRLHYQRFNGAPTPGDAHHKSKGRHLPPYKWLYGGGVRIKRIAYFENDTDKAYYDDETIAQNYSPPVKVVNFDYQLFDDNLQSSGALVVGRAVNEYQTTRWSNIRMCDSSEGVSNMPEVNSYINRVSYINSPMLQSKGGLVGYSNVTVYESNKGKKRFTYTSPIDVTENSFVVYPFTAPSLKDYRKGLLKSEETFSETGVKLKQVTNTYSFVESEVITGLNIFTPQFLSCPFTPPTYDGYQTLLEACEDAPPLYCYSCGEPDNFIDYTVLKEYLGWAKLSSTITKEYLPKRDGTISSITSVEEYEYNPLNQQVSLYKKRVVGTPDAEEERKEFTYYLPPNYLQNNRITEIQQIKSYEGSNLLANQVINYSPTPPYLPENIASAKGTATPEQKVQFLSYDSFGRPRQVKQPDGITITYIWGNTSMGPLAMIENADLYRIAQALNINLSMAMALSEITMPLIDSLRQELPEARVTTYTYKQLAGVETITDPRGATTTFSYDAFGRLEKVTDFDGHVLSANEYHYRTQN